MCFCPISEFIYRMFCNNISKFKPQFQSLSHGGTKSAEVYGVSRFTAHSPPGAWRNRGQPQVLLESMLVRFMYNVYSHKYQPPLCYVSVYLCAIDTSMRLRLPPSSPLCIPYYIGNLLSHFISWINHFLSKVIVFIIKVVFLQW